ncbi:general odorant-binding protein 56a-like [Calliphora vicina]|uniref:general odorant-binding protein 56a-like n=1 Tax=Calliphora vicina TaxID=7373 RepID=UPI00325BD08C
MKIYITLAAICLIASAAALSIESLNSLREKTEIEAQYQECAKQENVSEEDATKLRNKDFANATPGMKCLGTCFFEKVGILKDSIVQDDVVLAKLVPQYGEENVKNALEKCKNEKGVDRCETGFKIYECAEYARAEWGH